MYGNVKEIDWMQPRAEYLKDYLWIHKHPYKTYLNPPILLESGALTRVSFPCHQMVTGEVASLNNLAFLVGYITLDKEREKNLTA